MGRLVINFHIPLAGVEVFRFALGEGKKSYDSKEGVGDHEKLHYVEISVTQESVPKRTVYHVAATDSHRLFHFSWDKQKGDQDIGLPIYLDSRSIRELLSSIPSSDRRTAGYRLRRQDDDICLDAVGSEQTWSIPVCTVQESAEAAAKYPAWRDKLVHGEKAPIGGWKTHDFTVDGWFLTSFVKYLEDMANYERDKDSTFRAKDFRGIRFRYNQPPNAPMILTDVDLITEGKVEYILMPMYTPESTRP